MWRRCSRVFRRPGRHIHREHQRPAGTGSSTSTIRDPCCAGGVPAPVAMVMEEVDRADVLAAGGGISSSSEPKGFRLLMVSQPAIVAASATTVSLRLVIRWFVSGDMIDGCSSMVVWACPAASVAIICRVDAVQAAKHVTIPVQNRVWRPRFHVALSVILFNKVKNSGAFSSNLHEYWLEQL